MAATSSSATIASLPGDAGDPSWASVLDSLESRIAPRELRALVEQSRFLGADGARLPAAVRADVVERWRRKGWLQLLCDAVARAASGRAGPRELAVTPVTDQELRLRAPHRSLEDVVVSAANQAAHDHLFDHPSSGVSLLVGSSGSGKTHLLLALCEADPDSGRSLQTLFLSAEQLTLGLLHAVQRHGLAFIRKHLRDPDLLIVDGLERLDGRTGSQRELADAVADLDAHGRRVVLASRRPPAEFERLGRPFRRVLERARRLDLRPPSRPVRAEILRRRIARWDVPTEADALSWLTTELGDDLAALDALLTRVLAHPTSADGLVDPERHRRELRSAAIRPPIAPATILGRVCRHFNLKPADLHGPGRSPRVTLPRQIAMYLLRHQGRLSYPEIGQRLRRHHTTALYACRRIKIRRGEDSRVAAALDLLEKDLEEPPEKDWRTRG